MSSNSSVCTELVGMEFTLAKAYLPLKKHRKIGKRAAEGVRTIKIVRDDGGKTVQALVFRGNRWQSEAVNRELILAEK